MKEKSMVIGILGGMGTFATINMFKQYAEVFPAEKEWDRPRILIDNRCTMPSRVRAFLYNENTEKLVNQMADSMNHLLEAGCNKIILACNTSHLFLNKIYEKYPQLENSVQNIINNCADKVIEDGNKEIYLLGSEGTIESKVYQNAFIERGGVQCNVPKQDEYSDLRDCIEAVKQDKYTSETKKKFLNLVNRYEACILGCTELPILYEKYCNDIECKKIYDPVMITLEKLKKEYDNE